MFLDRFSFLGKKGKKSKPKTLNLQEFLSDTSTGGASVAQVTKNISWSDECYDFDDYAAPPKFVSVSLPTAPRSTRVLDDSTIPQNPPFLAYMSNLPYDLNEQDLQEFFEETLECDVVSVRLPREDGDSGRMRGFGYVEFAERDHLIAAVSLPDPQLRNRKIRIDVSTEQDQKRGGGRGRYDNFGASSEIRDTNWRRGDGNSRQQDDGEYGARRGGFGHNRERQRDNSQEGGSGGDGGNWRSGDRPKNESPPPPIRRDREPRDRDARDRDMGRDNRDRDSGRDNRDRDMGRDNRDRDSGRDNRDRDSGRDRYGGRRNGFEERPRRDEPVPEDRPRLVLNPRTLPLPEFNPQIEEDEAKPEIAVKDAPPRPKPVPAAAIFGAAKPVDTAAKDREIEERLERERVQKQKDDEEKAKREQEQKELEKEQRKNEEESSNGVAADGEAEHETNDGEEKPEPAAAPVVEKKETISWRRKSDDPEEPSRTQSPPRRRYSPDRRNRRNNGMYSLGSRRREMFLCHFHFKL